MKNKQKSKSIPDFQRDDNIWVRSDEKRKRLYSIAISHKLIRTMSLKEKNMLNNLQMHFDDQTAGIELTSENVKDTIKSGSDTAPGPDGIKNCHLKQLCDADIEAITQVFNDSLASGEIPTDWLDSHLAPVPKPEKDPSKIASYRIITMQNTIGKLPEKIVARMLAQELEEKNLLPPTLGSYRRGKDTWMYAAVMASDVYDGFERGEETLWSRWS